MSVAEMVKLKGSTGALLSLEAGADRMSELIGEYVARIDSMSNFFTKYAIAMSCAFFGCILSYYYFSSRADWHYNGLFIYYSVTAANILAWVYYQKTVIFRKQRLYRALISGLDMLVRRTSQLEDGANLEMARRIELRVRLREAESILKGRKIKP